MRVEWLVDSLFLCQLQRMTGPPLIQNFWICSSKGSLSWASWMFLFFLIFNWRMIALQYCVDFYHILTWISHIWVSLINNNLLTFRLRACMHACSVSTVVSISLQPYGLYSPPGSSVQGILQAKILEWVAMPSSKGSSQSKDQTQVSCTAGRFFTPESPGKPNVHTTCPLLQKNYISI